MLRDCGPTHARDYRPEIDGLRAVAVLAVIAYHAFPLSLPGGFCGVDVFFVISGFLITGIILRDRAAGRFSLPAFYARRIRRIFPTVSTVLALCLALGHRVLLPEEYRDLGKHAAASVCFAENFNLYREAGYFAPAAERLPLLHLWSLAIEEQFYLIYPLVLLAVTALRLSLRWTLAASLAASMASCIITARYDQTASFYLPWNRAWELLAGALLATTSLGQRPLRRRWMAECASTGGVVALAFAMFGLNTGIPYPGWPAVIPVVAAMLIIAAGEQSWFNRRVLASRFLVGIGLVSYPLYLFHWPVLSFLHLNDGVAFSYLPGRILTALVAAVLAALVTYLAVEGPIRRHRGRFVVAALCIVMATIGAFGMMAARGFVPNGNESPGVRQVLAAIADSPWKSLPPAISTEANVWTIGGRGPRTLMYGDSMAQQCLPRIVRLLEDVGPDGRGAVVIASGGVPPIPGVRNRKIRSDPIALERRFRRALDEDPSIDRVVVSGAWIVYFSRFAMATIEGMSLAEDAGRAAAMKSLEEMLQMLVARGKQVTLVLDYPSYHPKCDPNAFLRRGLDGIKRISPTPPTVVEMEANVPVMREIQNRIREICERHGIEVIDPMRFLCPDGSCIGEAADGPIRYDAGHLRASYVRDHLRFLDHLFVP